MDLHAIPPYRFVCAACGKTSATRYGLPGSDHDRGWDASCMLNCVLCEPTEPNRPPPTDPDESHGPWRAVDNAIEGVHYVTEEPTLV